MSSDVKKMKSACQIFLDIANFVTSYHTTFSQNPASALSYYVVRLYSSYNSYPVVTEATGPSLKADNFNHVTVDS